MKKFLQITFSLVFVLISTYSLSQNWIPINTSEKFNYRFETAEYITNTIWVDSTLIEDGNPTHFLNRIARPCDTCTLNSWTNFILGNQPQFLQRKMIDLGDGIYKFEDSLNLVIKTKALHMQSWIYDEDLFITATVTNLYEDYVFGELDSIKTISLNNGDSILLSKEHGLLLFPEQNNGYYYLEGIEGRNLGTIIPKFHDFFNFEVGDVFYYHYADYYGDGYSGGIWDWYKKVILNKEVYEDSIRYQIRRFGYWIPSFDPAQAKNSILNNYYDYTEYETFYDSSNHISNSYNHNLLPYHPYGFIGIPTYIISNTFLNEDGKVTKSLGSNYDSYNSIFMQTNTPNLYESLSTDMLYSTYCESIGLNGYWLWDFEYTESYELRGYIKDGDTTGYLPPDSELLSSILKISNHQTINIYPNPSSDIVFIDLPSNKSKVKLDIYSIHGKLIRSENHDGSKLEINIKDLENGIYIIKIDNSDAIFSGKFIKQ